jgi:hypothetical protein
MRGVSAAAPRDPWIRFTLIFATLAVLSELVYYGVALESALFRDYLAAGRARLRLDPVAARGRRVRERHGGDQRPLLGGDRARLRRLPDVRAAHRRDRRVPRALRPQGVGDRSGSRCGSTCCNFVRIVGLVLIGGYAHSHFQRSHEIYFPIFLIAMTVCAWVVWVRRATHERFGESATPA